MMTQNSVRKMFETTLNESSDEQENCKMRHADVYKSENNSLASGADPVSGSMDINECMRNERGEDTFEDSLDTSLYSEIEEFLSPNYSLVSGSTEISSEIKSSKNTGSSFSMIYEGIEDRNNMETSLRQTRSVTDGKKIENNHPGASGNFVLVAHHNSTEEEFSDFANNEKRSPRQKSKRKDAIANIKAKTLQLDDFVSILNRIRDLALNENKGKRSSNVHKRITVKLLTKRLLRLFEEKKESPRECKTTLAEQLSGNTEAKVRNSESSVLYIDDSIGKSLDSDRINEIIDSLEIQSKDLSVISDQQIKIFKQLEKIRKEKMGPTTRSSIPKGNVLIQDEKIEEIKSDIRSASRSLKNISARLKKIEESARSEQDWHKELQKWENFALKNEAIVTSVFDKVNTNMEHALRRAVNEIKLSLGMLPMTGNDKWDSVSVVEETERHKTPRQDDGSVVTENKSAIEEVIGELSLVPDEYMAEVANPLQSNTEVIDMEIDEDLCVVEELCEPSNDSERDVEVELLPNEFFYQLEEYRRNQEKRFREQKDNVLDCSNGEEQRIREHTVKHGLFKIPEKSNIRTLDDPKSREVRQQGFYDAGPGDRLKDRPPLTYPNDVPLGRTHVQTMKKQNEIPTFRRGPNIGERNKQIQRLNRGVVTGHVYCVSGDNSETRPKYYRAHDVKAINVSQAQPDPIEKQNQVAAATQYNSEEVNSAIPNWSLEHDGNFVRTPATVVIRPLHRNADKELIVDKIKKAISPTKMGIDIIANQTDSEGLLNVTCASMRYAYRLLSIIDMSDDLRTCMRGEIIGKRLPAFKILSVPVDIDREDALEQLRMEFNDDNIKIITELASFKRQWCTWVIEVSPRIAEFLFCYKQVKIGGRYYKVTEYYDIHRCYRCNRYGHTSDICRMRLPICARCTNQHVTHECRYRGKPKCMNCVQMNFEFGTCVDIYHAAEDNSRCSVFKNEVLRVQGETLYMT